MNFAVLWLFTKVFSAKFGGMAKFGGVVSFGERFIHKDRIFHQFAKVFSLESFPLYGSFASPVPRPSSF